MPALHRHQLVRLNAAGWASVQDRSWDAEARDCLAFWAAQQLPLVVTQQRSGLADDQVALGLSAPGQWQRRRLALQVPVSGLLCFDEFPAPARIAELLPRAALSTWLHLSGRVAQQGADVRVYGSYGWQQLTGLDYLREGSDVDLRLLVPDAVVADRVAMALDNAPPELPRLDGELVFIDGSAVAWREWLAWRTQRVDRILVKRLNGVAMEHTAAWLTEPQPC